MAKFCYWTAVNGEYFYLAKSMICSARQCGVDEDFIVISDKEVPGSRHINGSISPSEQWGCWFKFYFLKRYLYGLDYDYFVWLDSENYFVRKPRNVLSTMHGSPLHSFLECDLVNKHNGRKDWWGCPNEKLVDYYRKMGVISEKIYNVNGGLFIIKRSFIDEFLRIVDDFYKYCCSNGYRFVDEVPLAYATQLVCGDSELHTIDLHKDVWHCDWIGNYKDKIPDGEPWISEHYMTGDRTTVNPSIVHAMRSKGALIDLGKQC